MNTPIFDELEAKWNAVGEDQRICDEYTRCFYIETGAEWFEDIEGNEVFLPPTLTELNEGVDLTAYIVPNEVKVGDAVTPIKLGEPQYAEGGIVTKVDPKLPVKIVNGYIELDDCPVALVPKRKFKLFGRNQGTNGTL